ncbi:MAG: hypothetical protein R3247_00035 [Rhodothermales bacterium]|nr:hypothetical protein [Rhodothermales bacterium]
MPRRFLPLLLAALTLPGCLPEADVPEVTLAEAFAFEVVGRGLRASLDTTEVAIRDAATWAAYRDSLRPLQPFDSVDFAQEMVLLAAVPVPSGGYSIEFETVERAGGDSLTAAYILSTPGYDCIPTMGGAVVFQAVRMARIPAPVHFTHQTEAYRCTER